MKKLILLLLLLVLILTSCGARKVDVSKIEIKKDSIVETKVLVTTIENKEKTDSTNIVTTIDNSEIVITPIDTCKEIVVEGKVYKNVVLRIRKNKVNTLYTNKKRESNNKRKDSVAVIKVNKTEGISSKNKTIDKKTNYCWFIWLLILTLILYLLWRNKTWILRRL